jgi:hypothetical protein
MRLWALQIAVVGAGAAFAFLVEQMPSRLAPQIAGCEAPKNVAQKKQCDDLRQWVLKG